MLIFLIIGLLLGGAAVIFALQNITAVTVTFFSWQFEGSLAMIVLISGNRYTRKLAPVFAGYD